jgi:LysR family transcriptional regulator, low CO2-responsive transcriptional regulator
MDAQTSAQLLRRISLRQLQIFDAIARTGSFTRAADALFLTQPTVSMQIRKLEDGIGMPLFEHVGKHTHLTAAGKVVHVHAREALDALEHLHMEIADMKGLKTGTLHLAVVTTAKYFAPRALGRFCERHPGVDVALKVTNRERLLERLAGNVDDLYVMGHPPNSSDVVFEPYLDNPLVVVASRKHPLAGCRGVTARDLAGCSFIMREPGSGTRMATENYFAEQGIRPRIRMELGSNEAIKQAIDAGLGISILSRHTLGFDGESGRLAILDVEGFPIPWQWYVGHARGKRLSVVARAFLEFLRNEGERIMGPRSDAAA